MLFLSSVAGFAGDNDVLALLLLIDHVSVAGFAGAMAGKGNRPGGDLRDCGAPIVPILPKTARNDGGAQDDERNQCDRHDNGEPDEMFDVLEQVVFLRWAAWRYLRVKIRNALGYLRFVSGTMIEVTGTCDDGHRAVLRMLLLLRQD